MKEVPLYKLVSGHPKNPESCEYEIVGYAQVDDADYDAVMKHRWRKNEAGYAYACFVNGMVSMHKFVHFINYGPPDEEKTIDHADRNPLNNQSRNIRMATRKQQNFNRKLNPKNKTGFRGVLWVKRDGSHRVRLGRLGILAQYKKAHEAAFAYDVAVMCVEPVFSILNKIPEPIEIDRQIEIAKRLVDKMRNKNIISIDPSVVIDEEWLKNLFGERNPFLDGLNRWED